MFSICFLFSRVEFGERYPRATDEVWYKRAVEQHYMESSSFVYSVDFDAGRRYPGLGDDEVPPPPGGGRPLVIATHAVFHTVEGKSAPAAVVGFQFHHSSLHTLFTNITSSVSYDKTINLIYVAVAYVIRPWLSPYMDIAYVIQEVVLKHIHCFKGCHVVV